MPDFILNGFNNTVTNTDNFTRATAVVETAIVAPTANLYIPAAQWNTLFAYGENIYRTYADELPALTSNGLNLTLTGNGTGAVIDYVTTSGTQMTAWKFASAGARYSIGEILKFSLSSQGATVDNIFAADYLLVEGDLDLGPIKQTLSGLTTSVASGTYAEGQYLTGPNKPDGIYSNLLSYEYAGTSGANAVLASVTIANNAIISATWQSAGGNYAVGDTFNIAVDGTKFATYSIVAGDISGGAMAPLTPSTPIKKYITIDIAIGAAASVGTGAVVNRVTVNNSNQITIVDFAEVGSGFVAANQLTVTIDGTAFNPLTLTLLNLTGGIKTALINSKTLSFANTAATYTNAIITFTGGTGSGAIVDTVTIDATYHITAITFAGRGYGYIASDILTFSTTDAGVNQRQHSAYTLQAADINADGSLKDLTGKSLAQSSGIDYTQASILINKRTLAIQKLATPAGTVLQEPEETRQTIADDAIRHFLFGITGSYNQQTAFSNLENINTTIDDLLTAPGGLGLDAKLTTSILNANGNTDATTTIGNLTRQLFLQLSNIEPARLTNNAFGQYNNDNILSNLLGSLSGITSTTGTYTTANGISATFNGTGLGSELESITVRNNKVVGVKFTKPGNGYAASDTITFTGSGLLRPYIGIITTTPTDMVAGTYTGVALDGTTGSGAIATIVVTDATTIGSITITTPGKGYVREETITLLSTALGGGTSAVLTLDASDIGSATFSAPYTLTAADLDASGGLSNNLYNFTFESSDSITFQVTIAPKSNAANGGQTSINYAIKVTII